MSLRQFRPAQPQAGRGPFKAFAAVLGLLVLAALTPFLKSVGWPQRASSPLACQCRAQPPVAPVAAGGEWPCPAQLAKYRAVPDTSTRYVGEEELSAAAQPAPRQAGDAPSLPRWNYTAGQLRATHYFSSGNPLDFWERVELSHVEQELRQMQLDGFDAIILVVPWGGFQVTVDPASFDPWLYNRLHAVLAAARRVGMYVVARIGYAHNYNPDNMPHSDGRCSALLANRGVAMPAWVAYVRSLQAVFQHYDNFLFAFTSWEDNFCVLGVMGGPLEVRATVARTSGFLEWLREQEGVAGNDTAVPINDGSNPAMVRKWRDFYQTIWKDVLLSGRAVMPHLTMEVRVDMDPIYQADKSIEWYANDMLAGVLGPEVPRMIYYASFWGAENKNKSMPAETALGKLRYMLETVAERANTSLLFVNQFNFVDNTPNFVGVHDYIEPAQVPAFLRGAAGLFRQRSMGYGLWSTRAYRQSHLYNPSFERGFHGWAVEGRNASIVVDPAGDSAALVHAQGGRAALSLRAPAQPTIACDGLLLRHAVCATYHLLRGRPSVEVRLNGEVAQVNLTLGDPPTELCTRFHLGQRAETLELSFLVPEGTALVLDDVDLSCHLQTLDVYDDTGMPGPYLLPVRELNYALRKSPLNDSELLAPPL